MWPHCHDTGLWDPGDTRGSTGQVWEGALRWWGCHPTLIEYLLCTKHWNRCGGYKHKCRRNPDIGGAQRVRERQEHRPFCFRAFAANSSRETEKQKRKHQTWRSYESFAKVARKVQAQATESASTDSAWLGDIRLSSFPSQRLGFQICKMQIKIPSLRVFESIK